MPRFDPHPERRAAIVTGASSGIGAATAKELAGVGHPVVIGARRIDRLEDLAGELRAGGAEVLALPLDLTRPESVDEFAARAESEMGPIEILVSNAGDVQPITTVASPDEFARQLQVNLLGAQALAHAVVPAMYERRRGDVVFVTSEVALSPRTHMAAYVASKAGLEGFARRQVAPSQACGLTEPRAREQEQGVEHRAVVLDARVRKELLHLEAREPVAPASLRVGILGAREHVARDHRARVL